MTSGGLCLVIGGGGTVFDAAKRLARALGVTVLQLDDSDPPPTRDFDVIRGRIGKATGALGGFELSFDAVRRIRPVGRGDWRWSAPPLAASPPWRTPFWKPPAWSERSRNRFT